MKKKIAVFLIAVSLCFATQVMAFETPGPFKISSLYISHAGNYHFRVYSNKPSNWHCHGGPINPAWSYINESDSGAKGKIATLQLAYALGKNVHILTEKIGNYCHIVELMIQD